jgi:hypothetical protein
VTILRAALAALGILALAGCGSEPADETGAALEPAQIERALRSSLQLPGSTANDLTFSCDLPSGDGIEDRWDCVAQAATPATEAEERENRMDFPDSRGLRVELAVWVAAPQPGEFPSGSFAAVQVGGDALYEGGGAVATGGCCIEDADLETPTKFLE